MMMRGIKSDSGLLAAFVYFFISLLCLFLYSFGWSGGWHFDDAPNLERLSQVFSQARLNGNAAIEFVFSGDAGPLGRSIALASFLIDGSGWPFYPEEMLYTNSLLHILNGTLLFAILLNLGRLQGWEVSKSAWIAALSAGLWLLLPISASSSLMAVQRMAVLSNSFMLLGLWFYLLGRAQLGISSWRCWLWMVGGLGGGTLIGVLTKEQAAILPLLVWVLEAWLLPRPQLDKNAHRNLWRLFQFLFFYFPAFLILAYLMHVVLSAQEIYVTREFDLAQRLWTQSIILWDYLRLGFFPRSSGFGPFHDDYHIYDVGFPTVIAVLSWGAFFVIAWCVRKKTKLLMFALLWFLVAHLIESSVVPLELYFEHRNYLAMAGPMFALLVALWEWGERNRKIRLVGLVVLAYGGIMASVLFQVTSLFGDSELAAEIWYIEHPGSMRASQYIAQQYSKKNELDVSLRILDDAARKNINSGALTLQGLQLACVLNKPQGDLEQRLEQVLKELPIAPQRFAITQTLGKLKVLHDNEDCEGFIRQRHLRLIAQGALNNPHISAVAIEKSNLHMFLALQAIEARNLDQTMHHLLGALDAYPQISTLKLTSGVLRSAGIGEEMTSILEQYQPRWPRNPWLRKRMQKEWREITELVDSTRKDN